MILLAWVASFAIVGLYLAMTLGRVPVRWYDIANVLGAPPIIWVQVEAGVIPAAFLTSTYFIVGIVGWLHKLQFEED